MEGASLQRKHLRNWKWKLIVLLCENFVPRDAAKLEENEESFAVKLQKFTRHADIGKLYVGPRDVFRKHRRIQRDSIHNLRGAPDGCLRFLPVKSGEILVNVPLVTCPGAIVILPVRSTGTSLVELRNGFSGFLRTNQTIISLKTENLICKF
jgi:hypothetical protein